MKSTSLIAVFTLVVMCLSSMTSVAQDEGQRYQGFVVWEDPVYPYKTEAYLEATKMQMDLFKKTQFSPLGRNLSNH